MTLLGAILLRAAPGSSGKRIAPSFFSSFDTPDDLLFSSDDVGLSRKFYSLRSMAPGFLASACADLRLLKLSPVTFFMFLAKFPNFMAVSASLSSFD